MATPVVDEIWSAVSDRVGEDLRAVTHYRPMDFDIRLRPDLDEAYTPGETEAIADDTIVKQLGIQRVASQFRAGRFEGLVRIFEDAWILSCPVPGDAKSGVIVSIERGSAATMADVDWCVEYLEDEVGPQLRA